jgi:hypothetical protein
VICPDSLCDGRPSWYWNGDSCVMIDCGACAGSDCASAAFFSESECMAAHAGCEATLCRASGGTWVWWAPECAHYECGHPVIRECYARQPVCDCGPYRNFEPAIGCVDADCPDPEPATREQLCRATSGIWSDICCDTVCGAPCDALCDAYACDCGIGREFETTRGCVDTARCHERLPGEACSGVSRCQSGTICCQHCGGAGCWGEPTCDAPHCPPDEGFDECGNCLLCA